jgi:3-hydroxyacyl-CoA dehydrogenase
MIAETTRKTTPAPHHMDRQNQWGMIRRAAVLGAGTMGSRIAAHLANAGLPVVLLDLASNEGQRNRIAWQAIEQLKKGKPAAFFDAADAARITLGNFDDDLHLLSSCDWVIEAVTEDLEIKQALLQKAASHLKPDGIFTTNTSGLPVASIGAVLPADVRRRWFGTHFFNPPRYMRLLEIIPTPEADSAAVEAIVHFADVRLGKEVVFARDTPNFIANRIGVFIMLQAIRLMESEDLTVEEVDALTGTAIGWPRTATFRLADLVGLDVMAHVVSNFSRLRNSSAGEMQMPRFIQAMLERGWLGDKAGQGFYKKGKDEAGHEVRLVLNWKTLEYQPARRPSFPALEMAKHAERLPERLLQLLSGDVNQDRGVRFHWRLLGALWNYAADCLPEIADHAASVDRAMRAGFNWELGPFELWDAAGVRNTVDRMRSAGERVSPNVERLLASGGESWYRNAGRECFDPQRSVYIEVPAVSGVARIATFKARNGVVKRNPGASVVDLDDGIACIELQATKNAIGGDIVQMVTDTLHPESSLLRNFDALVISGDATQFSVGANLMQLLLSIQQEEWDEIEWMVKSFQEMTWLVKYCPRPVVVAPFGLCLGGGAELALAGVRRQVYAELYAGLVETGVGLIPAGGGCKEMLLQAVDAATAIRGDSCAGSVELMDALRKNFETIAMAKVSTSATDARRLGFVKPGDQVTMNRERLLTDAKRLARLLADQGYAPPAPRTEIPAPGDSALATLQLGVHILREGGFISDYDVTVANRLAYVLCGGKLSPGAAVSEQYLLDLEREAFLSLCGQKKTQERIAFTLKTGKPLHN